MICAHQNAEISNQNYHLDAVSVCYTVSHSLPILFPTISIHINIIQQVCFCDAYI